MIHKGTGRVSGRTRSPAKGPESHGPLNAQLPPTGPVGAPTPVLSLVEIERMEPGPRRVQALNAYIAAGESKVRSARSLRNADLRAVAHSMGPSRAARACGMALTTVKGLLRGL